MAKPNLEDNPNRQAIYKELDDLGKKIGAEYGLEPEQIEVNTSPTGSTWVVRLELYIKDEAELRHLLGFMRDNKMIEGFE